MIKATPIVCFFASFFSYAGFITHIEVEDSSVVFSTDSMTPSTAACAADDKIAFRTVSLNTHQGRATYSLLVTALTKQHGIAVESANDCGDIDTIERAKKVSLTAATTSQSSEAHSIGVYKADGSSRVGTYIDFDRKTSVITYVDDEAKTELKTVAHAPSIYLYYSGLNCTGDLVVPDSMPNTMQLFNGKYYVADTNVKTRVQSRYNLNNHYCRGYGTSAFGTKLGEHPICGTGPCTIKQD
ncbi:hypothetical protein EXT48_21590 [Pseudoalteromonas sp. CO348]|uniref:hypothetical protein n=1 Tax=Pseudoalteromonas sp. CO348 TaxID=1777271 RepID=UPI001023DDEF|nr:hypothetical protein [Pseudoalteromonas sp. CO348]RZF98652.1 hypothetical protein EXT48_21590 [Pseudoalteromonas sp. CO348]